METWKKFKEATLTSNDSCWFHDKPSNQKRSYKHFPPKRRTIRMAATTVNHLHFYCFHLVSVYHLPLKTTCRPRFVYLPFTKSVDSNLREVLNAHGSRKSQYFWLFTILSQEWRWRIVSREQFWEKTTI